MARTPQDPQIRITEILDAADQLFFTKSYQGTTIKDIAKKMGVAQGMLYYYFKSKEEVLETLLDRHASALISEIKEITCLNNTSPSEKMALTVAAVLRKTSYKDGFLLNMLYDTQNLHIKDKLFRQLAVSLSPWLLNIIEEGTMNRDFCVSHAPTTVDYILVIMDFLSEALYEKTAADILSYRLRMAEALIEKALGAQEKTIHIILTGQI
ncbi:TetR/AcrR family transcriptional regulator [Pelosinus fermentans]|uniref:Transcriptional regulator, TetR family n=1 Tax=Pelosinus fermentans JBW45 TaxID=1192197 RepID=I9DE55_9FIRM|nr:TetR/AcrR family transcriptional regulator [Pelosinus fermentans]AJQ26168.1 transcriptional regulator, TetR family [Pelosinus fermentans JBW45]